MAMALRRHFQASCPPGALVQLVAVWMVYTFILFGSSAAVDPVEAVCKSGQDNSLDNNDETQIDHQYKALRASGEVPILYHQTSPAEFEKIVANGQMQPRANPAHNYAGPGIYFTTTPEATHRQARHKGIILKCEVLLGLLKRIETPNNWAWGEAEHAKYGYDSIEIANLEGVEYVVYDPARIISFVKLEFEDEKPEYAAEDLNQTVTPKGPKNSRVSPARDSKALKDIDVLYSWVDFLLFLLLCVTLAGLLLILLLVLLLIFDKDAWAEVVTWLMVFLSVPALLILILLLLVLLIAEMK